MRARFDVMRHAFWALADQGVSSLTNFALSVAVARELGTKELGVFSVAFATYTIALGICRALTSEPQLIRYSAAQLAIWRLAAAEAAGTALVIGALSGIMLILVSMKITGTLGEALLEIGFFMPCLLLQDNWRFALFSRGKGFAAFLNDSVWGIVMSIGLCFLFFSDGLSNLSSVILMWGVGASAAAIFGIAQSGIWPKPAKAWAWSKRHRDLGPKYAMELSIRLISGQVYVYVIGIIGGLTVLGMLRGGHLLFAPIQVILQGSGLFVVPEGARLIAGPSGPATLQRASIYFSVSLATLAAIWGMIVGLIPSNVGIFILGETWEPAREILIPIIVAWIALGLVTGAAAGLRVLAAVNGSLRATLVGSILGLSFGAGGAIVGGGAGAAWGIALAGCISVPIWWYQFWWACKQHNRRRPSL